MYLCVDYMYIIIKLIYVGILLHYRDIFLTYILNSNEYTQGNAIRLIIEIFSTMFFFVL